MSEFEAYTNLVIMGGLVLSMPFFYRACYTLGKLIIVKFFPPKYVNIEIKKNNGTIELVKIKITDDKALTKALLQATGRKIF